MVLLKSWNPETVGLWSITASSVPCAAEFPYDGIDLLDLHHVWLCVVRSFFVWEEAPFALIFATTFAPSLRQKINYQRSRANVRQKIQIKLSFAWERLAVDIFALNFSSRRGKNLLPESFLFSLWIAPGSLIGTTWIQLNLFSFFYMDCLLRKANAFAVSVKRECQRSLSETQSWNKFW